MILKLFNNNIEILTIIESFNDAYSDNYQNQGLFKTYIILIDPEKYAFDDLKSIVWTAASFFKVSLVDNNKKYKLGYLFNTLSFDTVYIGNTDIYPPENNINGPTGVEYKKYYQLIISNIFDNTTSAVDISKILEDIQRYIDDDNISQDERDKWREIWDYLQE